MIKYILAIGLVCSGQNYFAQNALLIPDTLDGTSINLTLQNGTHQFYSGINTATTGANGDILGPTLLLNNGDFVHFSVNNQLGDTTTIHWHGLHVSSQNDGGPHTTIAPGATWEPSFNIFDKAATYWYHPHLHGKTNEHVSKGIAGLIIVRDAEEAALTLPRTYGVDDFPLVIQTKDFDVNKEILVHTNSDDVVMVNATIDPFLDVPAQVIRYRILNGSSQRAFNLGLTNNKKFYQIASDGGLLSTPNQTARLVLAPGERAEILIDFTGMSGQTVSLKSYASELPNGVYGATNPGMMSGMTLNGYNPNPLNGNNFDLVDFNIGAQNSKPITTIPSNLVTITPLDESTANITRKLTFSAASMGQNQLNGKFLINNTSFDMMTINYTVPIDNIEIWELRNQSAISHPFHIHDVQFYVLDRNGATPPVSEQGRKDVIFVKPQETVRFIAQFEHFFNDTVPYMYHCHLLTHEDDGMMGQFVVSGPNGIEETSFNADLKVYPNPSNGVVYVELENQQKMDEVLVFDQLGRLVKSISVTQNKARISGLAAGVYVVQIVSGNETFNQRLIME